MPAQVIKITGARQHNLNNLHPEIARLGKSSLAFDALAGRTSPVPKERSKSSSQVVEQFCADEQNEWCPPAQSHPTKCGLRGSAAGVFPSFCTAGAGRRIR